MSEFVKNLTIAFENTVLCARTNQAVESYDYAKRMELHVKATLKKELESIVKEEKTAINNLKELIEKLGV